MKRQFGSVCKIGSQWHAYGPERRVNGRRRRPYLGSAETRRGAERLLYVANDVSLVAARALWVLRRGPKTAAELSRGLRINSRCLGSSLRALALRKMVEVSGKRPGWRYRVSVVSIWKAVT